MGRRPDFAEPERTPVGRDACPVEPARSGPRQSPRAPLAEPWRDALLRLSARLPIDVRSEELCEMFLAGIAPLYPPSALGVRLLAVGPGELCVIHRGPTAARVSSVHAGQRLFPTYAQEHVYEVPDGALGATLHVALDAASDAQVSLDPELGEHVALVLGSALGRIRTHARATVSTQAFDRLQAQVMETEKLASLGQIVAGVVHELNNPLTSIIAYSDYLTRKLARTKASDPEDVERLRRIGEAADRILKFTRDLVAYARPAGEERTLVQLGDLVERALSFCEHEFVASGVTLEPRSVGSLPKVRGVPGQLTQVFVNLFTNAAHAMDSGGRLRVDVREKDQGAWLEVVIADTGPGIPPQVMPRIFEPFFTTKTDGRGTGLGLSIVRDILEAHAGTIRVTSDPGHGTSFALRLPTAR